MEKSSVILPVWIAVGFVLGIGMDNIGAGVAIGVALGVAMYTTKRKTKENKSPGEQNDQNSG